MKNLFALFLLVGCTESAPSLPACDTLAPGYDKTARLYCSIDDCGPPPEIADVEFGATPDPNRGQWWCMESDDYSSTRDYVERSRKWARCVQTIAAAPAGGCFYVARDAEDGWCAP